MPGVFISYRRQDSSGHAGWLREGLAARLGRDRVFMDIDTIEPGLDFVDVLERAVDDCAVLLVLIGKEWLTTRGADGQRRLDDPKDYHRLEVEAALRRGIRVVPVLVEDATVPSADELPPALQTLARRHAFKLSDSKWGYDVDTLSAVVQKDLGNDGKAGGAQHDSQAKTKLAPRLAIALVACLAVGGAVAFAIDPDPPPPDPGMAYETLETSSGYETVVPSGPAWFTKPESEVSPGLYRTTIFGPRGIEIWVDHTPDEEARFSRNGRAVQKRRTIDHPVFGLADEWVFRGGLPRCESVPCVDYLMNNPGTGYAVLGGGGDYATARSVARRVALKLTPR